MSSPHPPPQSSTTPQPPLRAGILGAGLGSRLSSRAKTKPLALVAGRSLLSHLVDRLQKGGVGEITCALREELLTAEDKSSLPQSTTLSYEFVNTESSLHTLVELIHAMDSHRGPALFTMADTVLREADLLAFLAFCRSLKPEECAVLLTTFIDDESPLFAHLNEKNEVQKFGSERSDFITSGMYFLSAQSMEIAKEVERNGLHKMRNFLGELTQRNVSIKTFVVTKTIDVDHPSDLDKAAEFMQGN